MWSDRTYCEVNLTVTLVKGDLQTINLEHNPTIFVLLYTRQEGWKKECLLWMMTFCKNCVRNVRSLGKMVAHGPPLPLLQDKSQL